MRTFLALRQALLGSHTYWYLQQQSKVIFLLALGVLGCLHLRASECDRLQMKSMAHLCEIQLLQSL